ncbi:MAG: class I SAM-dependent methyltransferase [Rhodocyclales bacterium]|nr:class I SAM-dependent methyltransferase [Rhodocyclales bacterium]
MLCALEHPYQAGRHDDDAPLRPGGSALTLRTLRSAGFAHGERILDLGCGVGAGSRLLRRHGCTPIGLDLAPGRSNRTAVAGNIGDLPFADGAFDGLLAECSLSLAGYTAKTLTECRRVLRPGGKIAITDIFARAEGRPDAALPGCLAGIATRADILAALAAAGFAVQRWEDHSGVLKSLLAQLIFSGRDAEALWSGDGAAHTAALRACRPGYFLLIATQSARSA